MEARYRYLELSLETEPVAIIQDTENHGAWVQSTVSVPVER